MHKVRGWLLGVTLVLLSVGLAFPVWAEGSAEVSTDVLSQYIWRGFGLSNDSMVIEPSITVSYQNFSVNVWGNYDTNDQTLSPSQANWNETDLTLDYTYDKLPYGLSANAGTIYYALEGEDSFEIYAGLSATCPVTGINAGLTIYKEISHYPGWWFELSADRSFALPWYGASLDVGATALYLSSDDPASYPDPNNTTEAYSGWVNLDLSASVSIPVTKEITVTPKVAYSWAFTDDGKKLLAAGSVDNHHDHLYGGVGVSFSF